MLVDNLSFVLIFLASASRTVLPAKDIKFTNETINNSLKTAADASKLCCSQTFNDLPENIKDISSEKYYLSPAESKAMQIKREKEHNSTISTSTKGTFQHWFCTSHITQLTFINSLITMLTVVDMVSSVIRVFTFK